MPITHALMERIDVGIEWANENIPDWREHVDPKTVNIQWGSTCFLGQYWNSKHNPLDLDNDETGYCDALFAFFDGDIERTELLGFAYQWTMSVSMKELNEAWQLKFRELGLL